MPLRVVKRRHAESEIATTFAPPSAANLATSEPTFPKPWIATSSPSSDLPWRASVSCEAEEDAAAGRLLAAERAADRERLAGHDAQHRVALVHRERVEDPGHHGRARADVGGRDVLLRPDLVDDLGGVAARHPLELAGRHRRRDRRRPRPSPRRTGRFISEHFQVIHIASAFISSRVTAGVVADAALRRAARDVVGDAPAGEDLDRAVVHRGRDRHLDRLLALTEDPDEVVARSRSSSATFRSCCLRDPEGAFRRWIRVLDQRSSLSRAYCIRKPTCALVGLPPSCRPGDDPELVAPRRERRPARAASGEPERVRAREQVDDVIERAEERAAGAVEEHVEPGCRLDLRPRASDGRCGRRRR